MRTKESRLRRLQGLIPLLACPSCGGALVMQKDWLISESCGQRYPVRNGIPVLLPPEMVDQGLGGELGFDEDASMHPYSPASADIIEAHRGGWVLDLGAGGKHIEHANVVQIDVFRFPMTDVVGSADCLPFRGGVFDAVVSQAVFEHLQYPEVAAAEIWRVLKADGVAKVDTAFLQPEHAYPHHYFNATEAGLKHWFRDFELEWSGVEPYQHPKWALVWFLSVYLASLTDEHRRVLEVLSVSQCLDVLSRLARGVSIAEDASAVLALDALSDSKVRTLAAGVSVRARKRGGSAAIDRVAGSLGQGAHAALMGLERRVEQLVRLDRERSEYDVAREEMRQVADDRTRYLLQSYVAQRRDVSSDPGFFRPVTRLAIREIKRRLPDSLWAHLRTGYLSLLPATRRPSNSPVRLKTDKLTVLVWPETPVALLDLFFSLVHQSLGSWELWIGEHTDASYSMRRLIWELCTLDNRVKAMPVSAMVDGRSDGSWVIVPSGCQLSFDAVFELLTLANQSVGPGIVLADVVQFPESLGGRAVMRCHSLPAAGSKLQLNTTLTDIIATGASRHSFVVHKLTPRTQVVEKQDHGLAAWAHVPRPLFRLVSFSDK